MADFGEILAELRQERKMTQKDLAKEMFVTVGQFPTMRMAAITLILRN